MCGGVVEKWGMVGGEVIVTVTIEGIGGDRHSITLVKEYIEILGY